MNAFPIPITALVTGLLALMLVALSINVVVKRTRSKVLFGDGGDPSMTHAIRAQANFIEYVPMALLVIGMAEWLKSPGWAVYTLGVGLVVARLIHAWGLLGDVLAGRILGTTLSWIVIAAGGVMAIVLSR